MYCKECGKKIDDDSKFCQYCGTRLGGNDTKGTAVPKVLESKDPYFDYVFPGMLETFYSYFQQNFTGIDDKGNVLEGFGMIEYYINKKLVLQVIDYCERGSEVNHCLMLNFCLPDDKIINRLENCIYKDDFNDEFAAYYDDDFEKAAKVVSYILGAVCGIPKGAKLEYSLESC